MLVNFNRSIIINCLKSEEKALLYAPAVFWETDKFDELSIYAFIAYSK